MSQRPPALPARPKGGSSARPQLRGAQTDDFNHHQAGPPGDLSLDEQTAVLQAMNLDSPPGYSESPASYSPSVGRPTIPLPSRPSAVAPAPMPTLTPTPTPPAKEKSSAFQSKLKTALREAKYIAGGLVEHPHESTKHYTILRHSHGLVYYSGPYTNLAITIFSDREIPADRTLWLQRKGFSGKTGLKVGALMGARSTWIDVTPTMRGTPDQLDPDNERAWQRDIKKFLKHASKDVRGHRVRETDILRIPSDADDGYLRVVLCTAEGKKVLCGSPIFRLASSSTDVSTLRGASLKTMPLEIGMKIASVVANNTVTATLSPVADTARGFVSNEVAQVYQPGFIAQQAMSTAYDSEVQTRLDNMNEEYGQAREGSYDRLEQETYDALARPEIVGDDSGPAAPFPVRFSGRVVPGTGRSKALLNMPTANLTGVPEDLLWRYKGVFFGWAAVTWPNSEKKRERADQWEKAIILISPDPAKRKTVVDKNTVRVYVMQEFQSTSLLDAKLSLIMTGYLRAVPEVPPGQEPDVDAQLFDFYKDIAITTASLGRPAWSAESILDKIKTAASSRSLTERYVDLRQTTQKHLDRVPLHKLGVRTEGAALRDKLIGQGGVWVPRQPLTHASTV